MKLINSHIKGYRYSYSTTYEDFLFNGKVIPIVEEYVVALENNESWFVLVDEKGYIFDSYEDISE